MFITKYMNSKPTALDTGYAIGQKWVDTETGHEYVWNYLTSTVKIWCNNTESGRYSLSANQTSNLSANNHIEFNTKKTDSAWDVSTGSGQANGKITLSPGNYLVFYGGYAGHSQTGNAGGALRIKEDGTSNYFDNAFGLLSVASTVFEAPFSGMVAEVKITANTTIVCDITNNVFLSTLYAANCYMHIQRIK